MFHSDAMAGDVQYLRRESDRLFKSFLSCDHAKELDFFVALVQRFLYVLSFFTEVERRR